MKLVKTIKIKLKAMPGDFSPTVAAYTNAFNYACQVGFDNKLYNKIDLHNLTYEKTKNLFSLPSGLIQSARDKACESLKSVLNGNKKYKNCPKSKQQSIRYDQRSYSLKIDFENKIFKGSFSTVSGRKKFDFIMSNYSKEYFKSWNRKSADLCIKKNKVYLHIVFEKDIIDIPTNNVFVGMDRGINNLAVLSTNKFFTGKQIKRVSKKYSRIRRKLQKVGSKSAKRHLRKLSGKEQRFKADINHKISKQIISSLNPGDTLVLEDLTGIRDGSSKLNKTIRTAINSWNFYQLEQFLLYKANAKNICLVKVDPAYTSQTCSNKECGFCHKKNRVGHNFYCIWCRSKLNADLNASRNIRNKAQAIYMISCGANVNKPIVPAL